MKFLIVIFSVVIFVPRSAFSAEAIGLVPTVASPGLEGPAQNIHDILQALSKSKFPLEIQGEALVSGVLLNKFYEHQNFELAWTENKKLLRASRDLLNAIRQSDREGLEPKNYHLIPLSRMIDLVEEEGAHLPWQDIVDLDLLLTDSFLTYGSHLLSGCINPYSVDDDWFLTRRTGDLPSLLESALEKGDIRKTLTELVPTHPVYQRLRDALAKYRAIEKNQGWPSIGKGPAIRKGDSDARVPTLRQRLIIQGYLNQRYNEKTIFDVPLERSLIQFQKYHGLDADGVLGKTTWEALNVPVENRVRQLRINMERCRWLPADLGERNIFVNVPGFRLDVYENGKSVLDMKVIVGRKLRQTPVFSSKMNQIVLNPSWNVTKTVANSDILDHIREEPDYLQKNGFEVFSNYENNAPLVDPATVNWSQYDEKTLPFKFRQKPGSTNALGQIKFLFPNRFDVYLHDTSSRSLFEKRVRDFSSGCIRVQKPLELAEIVLKNDSNWSRDKLLKALKSSPEEKYISIKDPIPVHLMYWTAWVDDQNKVQFRDDIYERDEALNVALHQK